MIVGAEGNAVHDVLASVAVASTIRDSGDHGVAGVLDDRRLERFRTVVDRVELQALFTGTPTPGTEHRAEIRTTDESIFIEIRGAASGPPLRQKKPDVAAAHFARSIEISWTITKRKGHRQAEQRHRGRQPRDHTGFGSILIQLRIQFTHGVFHRIDVGRVFDA